MENPASGSLVDITLTDVLQVLSANHKSCTLYLKKGQERGEITLLDGGIVDARHGERQGDEAFFQLLAWEGADFFISSTPNPGVEVTLSKDLHTLILEWLERRERLQPEVPLEITTPQQAPQGTPEASTESHGTTASPGRDDILTFLKNLEARGLIRPLP